MSIVTKVSDTLVKVQGSVDSSSAPLFEEELLAAISRRSLTVDAEELTYISSSGLRVLLKAKKALGAELELINVSGEVFEILEMTGFTQILTVRKACRRISVEGLSVIGRGRTSTVYRIDADTIVKVFIPTFTYDMVQSELAKAKVAFMNGVPTAISYDVVKVGESYGVVYELLEAKAMSDCMKENPDRRDDYIRILANEIREMHKTEVTSEHYGSALATTMGALPYMKGRIFTDEEYEKARAVLENIPVRKTFVHGDCHIDNVMMQSEELMFIDFSCAGYGHPIFDLMSMYLNGACHQGVQFADYTAGEARHFWDVFLSTYLQTEDPEILAKVESHVAAFSSTRLLAGLLRIPDMLKPEEIAVYKAKIFECYDKGLEPICF